MTPLVGQVLRRHTEETFVDIGRVLAVDAQEGFYIWIPFPEVCKSGARKWYIKSPRKESLEDLVRETDAKLEVHISFVEHIAPSTWSLTDEQLRSNDRKSISRKTRRKLEGWMAKRDEQFEWIRPLVEAHATRPIHLMNPEAVAAWSMERQIELKMPYREPLVRAVRAYLLGGKNALLPNWHLSGAPGKPKLDCKARPGRKNAGTLRGISGSEGIQASAAVRSKLHRGWVKYKKKPRSVGQAFELTLKEFFSKGCQYVSATEVKVELLPNHLLPTIAQFKRHGPAGDPSLSATRINIGTHKWERNHLPTRGTARDGIHAIGQLGVIDSTSDDQTLASEASRTVMLSSPHNTKLVDAYTGYIMGFHSGFECPSTLTNLMTVVHAAGPKEDYCARYGIFLKPGEWVSMCFRRIRADNGELKSECGITQLSNAEISLEFVRSYAAELKGQVESTHHVMQRSVGHQMAASTQGEQHERGETRKEESFCVTHFEYMPNVIRAILKFNNEDRVEHLLTMEMRRDRVEPTRGAILKWMIANSYVVTEPTNLDQLRAICLPRLDARIYGDGVYLVDPTSDRADRLIKGLRYRSDWMDEAGVAARAAKKVIHCTVCIDPSNLSEVWLQMDGLQRLDLQTNDPGMSEVTLFDWLTIASDDRLAAFLDRCKNLPGGVNRTASIDHTNKEAMRKRKAEEKEAGGAKSRSDQKAGKRDATNKERTAQNNDRLGLGSVTQSSAPISQSTSEDDEYFADEADDWMNAVRTGSSR